MHPLCVTVYVKVTLPTPLGVKTPAFTPVPLHVPPVGLKPVNVYGLGVLHTLASGPAFTAGKGVTVTVTVVVPVHPRKSVTVTV